MQNTVSNTPESQSVGRPRHRPFIIMLVFLLLAIIGINVGEVPAVLEKATRLCLSCIGIG